MPASYVELGADPSNPSTHVLIKVGEREFSVFKGTEQATADLVAGEQNQ